MLLASANLLATRRTEMHDLSAQYPEKVQEMGGKWTKWSDYVGVLPWPLKKK